MSASICWEGDVKVGGVWVGGVGWGSPLGVVWGSNLGGVVGGSRSKLRNGRIAW